MPFDNPTVMIEVYQGIDNLPQDQGKVVVQIMAGESPLVREEVEFYSAVVSIAGEWATELAMPRQIYETDINGIVTETLPAGDYILVPSYGSTQNDLGGSWGIVGIHENTPRNFVPFPIVGGKVTRITVSLAQLDIGVISPDGHVRSGAVVNVYCQTTDIAGNPVAMDSGCSAEARKTSAEGIATHYLGAGTYIVKLFGENTEIYDITLAPGEYRLEIIDLSSAGDT
jgi:hypothetical protein